MNPAAVRQWDVAGALIGTFQRSPIASDLDYAPEFMDFHVSTTPPPQEALATKNREAGWRSKALGHIKDGRRFEDAVSNEAGGGTLIPAAYELFRAGYTHVRGEYACPRPAASPLLQRKHPRLSELHLQ